ncbi:hypothetical protein GHT06_013616 [Daphnia sinensis]|uniref:Secreted protein n=1 Tax=Daphnia sinensis TaxID=1820382 RepID=A0AAD5KSG1_9CRUS|nr:hypothetical protein GHT06_013616 [Daphnia sinensis]
MSSCFIFFSFLLYVQYLFGTCAPLICSFPDAKWQSGRKRRQPARAAGTYPQATRFRRKFLRLPCLQVSSTDGLL